jgi:PHD/YefM family antitoxin component YafN of YafNO toxin-antitoxin module
MQLTATETKNRFGFALTQCQTEPLAIVKNGLVQAFMISKEHYQTLCTSVTANDSTTMNEAQKAFTQKYQTYFDEQNKLIETHGIFGEEWRVW